MFRCAPGRVAGVSRDRVPVGVRRSDQDQRIMRGAAAQAGGARDRAPRPPAAPPSRAIRRIAFALRQVGVVVHEEMPGDGLVFRRERVERRNVVVVGQAVLVVARRVAAGQFVRIAAGLQHHHMAAGLRQPRGNACRRRRRSRRRCNRRRRVARGRAAACTCPAQNVLRNSIRARLSSSLSPAPQRIVGAEIVAAVDHEVRALAEPHTARARVGEDLGRASRRRPWPALPQVVRAAATTRPSSFHSCDSAVEQSGLSGSGSKLASRSTGVPFGIGPISMSPFASNTPGRASSAARAARSRIAGR